MINVYRKSRSSTQISGFFSSLRVFDNVTYQYSGDNAVRAISATGAVASISHPALTYEYDDKPNPYSGLLFPDEKPYYATRNHPLPAVVRQYSRNNITKITTVNLIYQYDSRGLPINVTTSGGTAGTKVGGYVVVGQMTTLTHESF